MRLPANTDARPRDARAILVTSIALVGFAYVTSRAYFLGETSSRAVATAWGGALALTLLGSLAAHRFAHRLAERHFGIQPRAIGLLPVGGRDDGRDSGQALGVEVRIALAGPLAHGLLALACFPLMKIAGVAGTFFFLIATMNSLLAMANLMPVPPLDGARILRAFARTHMPRRGRGVIETLDRALPAAFGPLSVMSLGTGSWLLLSLVAFLFVSANASNGGASQQPAPPGPSPGVRRASSTRRKPA